MWIGKKKWLNLDFNYVMSANLFEVDNECFAANSKFAKYCL